MKFPVIGGIVFVLSGVVAIAALSLSGNSTTETPTAAAAVPTAGDSLVLSVPTMHCEFACAPKVRETLAAVPGVEDVETNVEKHTATIRIGEGFDVEKALAALSAAGYPSDTVAE